MAEAEKRKLESETAVENLRTKLSSLSENKVTVSKGDKEKVAKDYESVMKIYKKRKRICTDILDSILENYPKKKSVLMEEIGIELDDDRTVSILKT